MLGVCASNLQTKFSLLGKCCLVYWACSSYSFFVSSLQQRRSILICYHYCYEIRLNFFEVQECNNFVLFFKNYVEISSSFALLNDLILVELITKFNMKTPGAYEGKAFCMLACCHQAFPKCSCVSDKRTCPLNIKEHDAISSITMTFD